MLLSSTEKKQTYISSKDIFYQLHTLWSGSITPALTRYDNIPSIFNHTKRSALNASFQTAHLSCWLVRGRLTEKTEVADKRAFIVYTLDHVDYVDMARCIMFSKACKPEAMSPTSNAFVSCYACSLPDPDLAARSLPGTRSAYTSGDGMRTTAHCPEPGLPTPTEME